MLGLGASGEAAAGLLHREGAMVTVLDSAALEALRERAERLRRLGIRVKTGSDADGDTEAYDFAVVSPGIDPAAPLVRNFIERRIDMIGELELAYEMCECPIIAITGTNGKTTTTELVATMLNDCGVRTIASGNIGLAFSSTIREAPLLDVVTLEVSSFQLETIRRFRPHVSVWLNLAPDHLDRYPSVEAYRDAKLRIFENQREEDFAIVNGREQLPPLRAQKITFSAYQTGGDFELRENVVLFRGAPALDLAGVKLRGLHNAENFMAALAVGWAQGLSFEAMRPSLASYNPAPHRCEHLGEIAQVAYVNDSKATNLDALEKALLSQTAPVVLIAGGKDKGFGFEPLAKLVAEKAHTVILIGEMAPRIAASWQAVVPCRIAASLAEAVALARTAAHPGDTVLFSPGTSSFDMFKNYAERGDQFRTLAQAQVNA